MTAGEQAQGRMAALARRARRALPDGVVAAVPAGARAGARALVTSSVGAEAAVTAADPLTRARAVDLTPSAPPRVSVVVPAFCRLDLTLECLESLAAAGTATPFEVVLVDDGSGDGSVDVLREVRGLVLVALEHNQGFTRAVNSGLRHVSGDYVVLLNNDARVMPGWLDGLVMAVDADPAVGMVGAKLVSESRFLEEAGSIVWSDGTTAQYGDSEVPWLTKFDFVRDVDYVSAACLLVRTRLLRQLGGLDERYAPAYYEDVDLAFGVRALGYRVIYQPLSSAHHRRHGSHDRQEAANLNERNRLRFCEKWGEALLEQPDPDVARVRRDADRRGLRALLLADVIPTPDTDSRSHRLHALVSVLGEMGFATAINPRDGLMREPWAHHLRQRGVEILADADDVDHYLDTCGTDVDVVVLAAGGGTVGDVETLRRRAPDAKIVYDTAGLRSRQLRAQALLREDDEPLPLDADRRQDGEAALAIAADSVLVVGEADRRALLAAAPDATVAVVGDVHERQRPVTVRDAGGRAGVLFVGDFDDPANVDAAEWLVHDIVPLLRARDPGLIVRVAGSHASDRINALAADGVQVVGWQADLWNVYSLARVACVPLRFGAGAAGKAGQALAYGVPTVSTAVGVEGVGPRSAACIAVADDAPAFAAAIEELLHDDRRWAERATQGQLAVEAERGVGATRDTLRSLFDGLGIVARRAPARVPA